MGDSIILPQVRLSFGRPLPKDQILLVAGGRPPQQAWLTQVARGVPVWCADSGIDVCQTCNVVPERIIGDGDSASSMGWSWGSTLGVPVEVHPPEKKLTDLQLTLKRIGDVYGKATVVITGVWGGRFDHTFSNIFSLLSCEEFGIQRCCAADEAEVLVLLKGDDAVRIQPNKGLEVVSLLPLSPDCSGVTIDGVYWPLVNAELHQNWPYAISNCPDGKCPEINVTIANGYLGVYLCWDQNALRKKIW